MMRCPRYYCTCSSSNLQHKLLLTSAWDACILVLLAVYRIAILANFQVGVDDLLNRSLWQACEQMTSVTTAIAIPSVAMSVVAAARDRAAVAIRYIRSLNSNCSICGACYTRGVHAMHAQCSLTSSFWLCAHVRCAAIIAIVETLCALAYSCYKVEPNQLPLYAIQSSTGIYRYNIIESVILAVQISEYYGTTDRHEHT
eukprot:10605-Heterococcus_DN1.PRE.3